MINMLRASLLLILLLTFCDSMAQSSTEIKPIDRSSESIDTSLETVLDPADIVPPSGLSDIEASRSESGIKSENLSPDGMEPKFVEGKKVCCEKKQVLEEGIQVTPIEKIDLPTLKEEPYSISELEVTALRMAANCTAIDASGNSGGAVIDLGEGFVVIPVKPSQLPPKPENGDATIHGVDSNKNCVRDDVEHLVFKMLPSGSDEEIRRHLFRYAVWLNFYLVENITEVSIRSVDRQLLRVGLCLTQDLPYHIAQKYETKVFARMHNTNARSLRYFENKEKLVGFDVDESATASC